MSEFDLLAFAAAAGMPAGRLGPGDLLSVGDQETTFFISTGFISTSDDGITLEKSDRGGPRQRCGIFTDEADAQRALIMIIGNAWRSTRRLPPRNVAAPSELTLVELAKRYAPVLTKFSVRETAAKTVETDKINKFDLIGFAAAAGLTAGTLGPDDLMGVGNDETQLFLSTGMGGFVVETSDRGEPRRRYGTFTDETDAQRCLIMIIGGIWRATRQLPPCGAAARPHGVIVQGETVQAGDRAALFGGTFYRATARAAEFAGLAELPLSEVAGRYAPALIKDSPSGV